MFFVCLFVFAFERKVNPEHTKTNFSAKRTRSKGQKQKIQDKGKEKGTMEKGQGYLSWMGSLRRVGKRLPEDREETDTAHRKIEVYKGKR